MYQEVCEWVDAIGYPYGVQDCYPSELEVQDFLEAGENPADIAVQWVAYVVDMRNDMNTQGS